MLVVFGIPNCDVVKKAQKWLRENEIEFRFHDFRKDGLSDTLIKDWMRQVSWEKLLNKKSTTWRELSAAQQESISNPKAAMALMIEKPSVIRRPVIVRNEEFVLNGFDEKLYEKLFS